MDKTLIAEQFKMATPSTCRYCGKPIYWEVMPDKKKKPVDAVSLEPHYCKHTN